MANDILLDDTGDLSIINGDLYVGNSDEQHVEHIMLADKGHYKQSPLIGVDIFRFLNSPITLLTRTKLEKEITLQLKSDKAKNIKVTMNKKGDLKVEAVYE